MIAIDFRAFGVSLLLLLVCYALYRWNKRLPFPEVLFSNSASIPSPSKLKRLWLQSPLLLEIMAFVFLLTAFMDPHFLFEKRVTSSGEPSSITPTEGIAIYFVLDRSGSMSEKVGGMTKMDRLKGVVADFIKENQGNMIGLLAFARGAHVLAPLTLDQQALLQKIAAFNPVADKEQDGTAIGYGIYKAANLIAATKHYAQELIQGGAPAYKINDTVMILVTDGIQDPNPLDEENPLRTMDISEAAAYANSDGIRLYVVNVEPRLEQDRFAPHRNQMQKAAESTGGRFFIAGTPDSLRDILKQIDGLEKSRFPPQIELLKSRKRTPFLYTRVDLYPYLIAAGLLSLFISIAVQTLWLRRVP